MDENNKHNKQYNFELTAAISMVAIEFGIMNRLLFLVEGSK